MLICPVVACVSLTTSATLEERSSFDESLSDRKRLPAYRIHLGMCVVCAFNGVCRAIPLKKFCNSVMVEIIESLRVKVSVFSRVP